jgi:hypothetical protein
MERHPPAIIPAIDFNEFFVFLRDFSTVKIEIVHPQFESGNISLYELLCLNIATAIIRPKLILEFGTFNGRTTMNLVANSNFNAIVYTVDLDDPDRAKLPLERKQNFEDVDELGFVGRKTKLYHKKAYRKHKKQIRQLWMDSAKFIDLHHLYNKENIEMLWDIIFVDASHSYENCLNDARTAMEVIKPQGGYIFFHDYGPTGWPGVVKALNEIYLENNFEKMHHINGTSLVCMLTKNRI